MKTILITTPPLKWLNLFRRDGWDFASRNSNPPEQVDLDRANAVQIVGVTRDKELVVIREFRRPLGRYMWSFPAGLVDEGEDENVTAVREFQEETGLELEPTGQSPVLATSAGLTDETVRLVFGHALGIPKKKGGIDASEDITIHLMTKKQMQALLISPPKGEGFCARAWPIFNEFADTGENSIDELLLMGG